MVIQIDEITRRCSVLQSWIEAGMLYFLCWEMHLLPCTKISHRHQGPQMLALATFYSIYLPFWVAD